MSAEKRKAYLFVHVAAGLLRVGDVLEDGRTILQVTEDYNLTYGSHVLLRLDRGRDMRVSTRGAETLRVKATVSV